MHRLIAEKAGHGALAGMMRFVDHTGEQDETEHGLGRLQAERRAEARRSNGAH
jgi:hypothetical protein